MEKSVSLEIFFFILFICYDYSNNAAATASKKSNGLEGSFVGAMKQNSKTKIYEQPLDSRKLSGYGENCTNEECHKFEELQDDETDNCYEDYGCGRCDKVTLKCTVFVCEEMICFVDPNRCIFNGCGPCHPDLHHCLPPTCEETSCLLDPNLCDVIECGACDTSTYHCLPQICVTMPCDPNDDKYGEKHCGECDRDKRTCTDPFFFNAPEDLMALNGLSGP